MTIPVWLASTLKAIGSALPWLLLFVVGLSMQAIQVTQKDLEPDVQFLLFSIGGAAALLGSFGVGARIGREQTNETLRIKLETAFRRTARNYARMRVIKDDLENAADMVSQAIQPKDLVPLHVIARGLDGVSIRLDDEITTYDNALDEWHELVPVEVDKERERLKAGTLA